MALIGTYTDATGTYNNVCAKITRIWGSKIEHWNAWVAVFKNSTAVEPITTFSIQAEYVEGENPYIALYTALSKMEYFSNVTSDILPKSEVNTIVENVKPKKKTRK